MVRVLIDAGAHLDPQDLIGMTPLVRARNKRVFVWIPRCRVCLFLPYMRFGHRQNRPPPSPTNTPPPKTSHTGSQIEGCTNGAAASVQLLLEAKCDPNMPTPQGSTALHRAQRTAAGATCIAALIKAGADVHARDWQDSTPLIYAAGNPGPDAVAALLAAGADANAQNSEGGLRFIFRRTGGNCLFMSPWVFSWLRWRLGGIFGD